MTYFFFGWLVCLTIIVGAKYWPRKASTSTADTWTYTPFPGTVNTTFKAKDTSTKAEFLASTRVDEIIKGKKDVKLGDILA